MAKKNDISTAVFGAIASVVVVAVTTEEVIKDVQDRSKSCKSADRTIGICIVIAIILIILFTKIDKQI